MIPAPGTNVYMNGWEIKLSQRNPSNFLCTILHEDHLLSSQCQLRNTILCICQCLSNNLKWNSWWTCKTVSWRSCTKIVMWNVFLVHRYARVHPKLCFDSTILTAGSKNIQSMKITEPYKGEHQIFLLDLIWKGGLPALYIIASNNYEVQKLTRFPRKHWNTYVYHQIYIKWDSICLATVFYEMINVNIYVGILHSFL